MVLEAISTVQKCNNCYLYRYSVAHGASEFTCILLPEPGLYFIHKT